MKKKDLILLIFDALTVSGSLYFSFLLRFEFDIPQNFESVLKSWLPWFTISHLFIFFVSEMYARIWRFTSLYDLYAIVFSVFISCSINYLGIFLIQGDEGYPRSVLVLFPIFLAIFSIASRLSIRVYYSHYYKSSFMSNGNKNKKRLLIIGAGKTGDKIAREIFNSHDNLYSIAGFIDDDPDKQGAFLHGKKILCGINKLPNLSIQYDEILITTPSVSGDKMRNIVEACKKTGKRYKTVPGINELIGGEINLSTVRDVSYVDLLGRDEIKLDLNSIDNLLGGKRILVTGAGGSIGMELVKQCLLFDPAEIICLDISEEKVYNIEQYSKTIKKKTILKTVLCSINYKDEVEKVFIENRPHIVFHAAAYKHVPIQEVHPWTAVNTNLGGTYNVVLLSDKYKVGKFVFVSTDKAVNPVNVMGATKRASEKLIQSFNSRSNTTYMAVRFGNVLGSSGSAIPTFQKQINQGGPLTITHPEMTRYFMSIQEASQLIIQCGTFGKDGEIFLLEMGKPIRIVQMAKDLIRLSGLEPEVDIPIVYSGLRPGEKLYEELQMFNETKVSTKHKKIMVLKENKPPTPWEELKKQLNDLLYAAKKLESDRIQLLLQNILPTYNPEPFKKTIESSSFNYEIEAEA